MNKTTTADEPEKFRFRHLPSLLKETGKEWNKDDPWRLSAVVAYYALLSLPGLLVIILNSVGAIWGEDIVQGRVTSQIADAVGQDAAKAIEEIVSETQDADKSWIATIISVATLIFGATGVFYHLQISINSIWDIKPDPKAGFKKLLIDRAMSFGYIMVIGFLLLVSFFITALLTFLSDYISRIMPEFMVYATMVLNALISLGIITVLFAMMFKFLPDARVKWRTVWIGSIITALLFVLGEFLLGLYFSKSNPGSAYGAAGSMIIILLWVSYACLILFYGAEFTWVYARRYTGGIKPRGHAMLVKEQEVIITRGSDLPENDEDDD